MWTVVLFIVCICAEQTLGNVLCLYCQEAVLPTDCDTVIKCGKHQMCYVDAVVNIGGFKRFNLGCRETQQCLSLAGLKRDVSAMNYTDVQQTFVATKEGVESLQHSVQEQSDSVTICSECCNDNLCANNGCASPGYPAIRGPICWNCHRQASHHDCNKITMCSENEVCVLQQTNDTMMHAVRYETRCIPDSTCIEDTGSNMRIENPGLIGRRLIAPKADRSSCRTHCCETDLCNNKCPITQSETTTSSSLQTSEMTTTTTQEPVTSTDPLTTTTTIQPTSYVDFPCASNPCGERGECSAHLDSYKCECFHGYWGQNCNNVRPTLSPAYYTSCDPDPCVNGICVDHDGYVQCECNDGFTGQICDAPAVCPDGFSHYGAKCYRVFRDKALTYSGAEALCSSYGAHLAIVKNTVDKTSVINVCLPGGLHGYWLGANDKAVEGEFRWVDNTRVTDSVQYWDTSRGQPDNKNNAEHCVELIMLRHFECESFLDSLRELISAEDNHISTGESLVNARNKDTASRRDASTVTKSDDQSMTAFLHTLSSRHSRQELMELLSRSGPPKDSISRGVDPPKLETQQRSGPPKATISRSVGPPKLETQQRSGPPKATISRSVGPPKLETQQRSGPPKATISRSVGPPKLETQQRSGPPKATISRSVGPPKLETQQRSGPPKATISRSVGPPKLETQQRSGPPKATISRSVGPPKLETQQRSGPPKATISRSVGPPKLETQQRSGPPKATISRSVGPPKLETQQKSDPPKLSEFSRSGPPKFYSQLRDIPLELLMLLRSGPPKRAVGSRDSREDHYINFNSRGGGFPWDEECARGYTHCEGYFPLCCERYVCLKPLTNWDKRNGLKRCWPDYFQTTNESDDDTDNEST
ncbi:C-type lectin domain 17 [Mactra antiquata]